MTCRIQIVLASIPVDDQEKALRFYTEAVGFEKSKDIPVGAHRWLTVTSPAGVHGVELLLEPNTHRGLREYQSTLYADRIPATTLFVDDIDTECKRMIGAGVQFLGPPTGMGGVKLALFDDTVGNWIGLTEIPS